MQIQHVLWNGVAPLRKRCGSRLREGLGVFGLALAMEVKSGDFGNHSALVIIPVGKDGL